MLVLLARIRIHLVSEPLKRLTLALAESKNRLPSLVIELNPLGGFVGALLDAGRGRFNSSRWKG
jgi:hypothetical protein